MVEGKRGGLVLSVLLVACVSGGRAQSSFSAREPFSATRYTGHNTIRTPRGIIVDAAGDILVLSRNTSQIIAIYEASGKVVTTVIVDEATSRLNHGIAFRDDFLYASNSSTVLRWKYVPGQRTRVTSTPEVVVSEIPEGGEHVTRSLIFDSANRLYVTVGSASDVDKDASRAKIRRFNLTAEIPADGFSFEDGEVFADGVRNVVGMALDAYQDLWGLDCGVDNLYRSDLGGDIHNTNPADELIKFGASGSNYGYPSCWTVDQLKDHVRGEQLSSDVSEHEDNWCKNTNNNRPPTLPIAAHNAPLGITFFDGLGCGSTRSSFPCSMKGDAFVALHGSWNRQPPAGYKVVRIPIDPVSRAPTGEVQDIVVEPSPEECSSSPTTCFRPVGLVFTSKAHLIVTSDSSDEVVQVLYLRPDSGSSSDKKWLHIPGVIAIALILVITLVILGLLVHAQCRRRGTQEVPYARNI